MVYALLALPGGDVLVGGQFEQIGGLPCTGLARYHPTTNTWTRIWTDGNTQDGVHAMSLRPDGRVLLVGILQPSTYDPATGAFESIPGAPWFGSRPIQSCVALPNGDLALCGENQGFISYFTAATGAWVSQVFDRGDSVGDRWSPVTLAWAGGDTPRLFSLGWPVQTFVDVNPPVPPFYSTTARAYVPSTGTFISAAAGGRLLQDLPTATPPLYQEYWPSFTASLTLRDGSVMVGGVSLRRLREGVLPPGNFQNLKWIPGFTRLYAGPGSTRTVITSHPAPRSAGPGQTVEFSVAAVGYGQLRYQWLKDGTAIDATANPSAGTATLRLVNVSTADLGVYACRVLNICDVEATSDAAGLSFCRVDLNGDGGVDFNDYLEFLNLFNAQSLVVDYNGDGAIDFNDYLEFVNQYNVGC